MSRPLALLGVALCVATATTTAQQLDLRVVPVTQGTVQAVRAIHVNPPSVAARSSVPQTVGVPSDLEDGPPVGAVIARPINAPTSERTWHLGTPASAETEDRRAQTGYEVVVTMDDGEQRTFPVRDASRFHPGQRVRVRAAEIEPVEN